MKKVKIIDGIEVNVNGKCIEVKGPKGGIIKNFSNPLFDKKIKIEKTEGEIIISSTDDSRKIKSMVGTISSILNNMIIGVTKGYKYTLKIYFVHFPITVETKSTENYTEILIKNFLGEKKPRKIKVKGVNVDVKGDLIILRGIDKELLGQVAGKLEYATKVKKKDRRIFNDGIFLIKKEVDE